MEQEQDKAPDTSENAGSGDANPPQTEPGTDAPAENAAPTEGQ